MEGHSGFTKSFQVSSYQTLGRFSKILLTPMITETAHLGLYKHGYLIAVRKPLALTLVGLSDLGSFRASILIFEFLM